MNFIFISICPLFGFGFINERDDHATISKLENSVTTTTTTTTTLYFTPSVESLLSQKGLLQLSFVKIL